MKKTFLLMISMAMAFSTIAQSSKDNTLTFNVNGVSLVMKRVEGGTFWMGAQGEDPKAPNYDNYEYVEFDGPVHSVTVSTFYMQETEVTEALWKAVMGDYPKQGWSDDDFDYSYEGMMSIGDNYPIQFPDWIEECETFVKKLNKLTGKQFRLPTEAEWEYAARGGNKSHGYKYAGSNDLDKVAWYDNNEGKQAHEVKQLQPNELGLYDMCGNIEEYCLDYFTEYSGNPQTNPCVTHPTEDGFDLHVIRGGNFESLDRQCRVSFRGINLDELLYGIGFRLVFSE